MKRVSVVGFLFSLILAAVAGPADAGEIKVLVNGQPITSYDIAQRMAMQRISGQTPSNRTATDELINEAVQLSEARRVGISVPQAQIDEAFNNIAAQVRMPPRQFVQALAQAGVDADSLRARLRVQIAWQTLMQARMQRATVRQQDITAELLSRGDAAQTMKEYRLQQIVFVVPRGSAAALYAQRRREAEAFRQRFRGCDGSLAQAGNLRGVVVRDIGRRDSTQLGGPQGQEIAKTREGRTISPFQTDQGIELLAVCEVREIRSTAAARAEIENRLLLAQGETIGKEYLDQLRERAVIQYR